MLLLSSIIGHMKTNIHRLLNNYSALPLSNDRPKRKAIEHVLNALRKRLAQEIAQAQAQGPQKSKA